MPRTNRGIFAINELPDLAERIQVGLLNVLEERDVQIRGYKVRLPLDVMLFASANPEDYTNRGRLITPLKDRFGAQIRTHYPLEVETEMAIVAQEARPLDRDAASTSHARVHVRDRRRPSPSWPARARTSTSAPACRSGCRSPTTRRSSPTPPGGRCGSARTTSCPASSDLDALASSTGGKVEIESLEDGRDGEIIERLLKAAMLTVFKDRCGTERLREVLAAFESGTVVHAGDDVACGRLRRALR